ncbi:hypothetical protein Droror1_Dr00026829, partial [Drosera rotundifolia]
MLTRPLDQGIYSGQLKQFLSLPICPHLTTKRNGQKGLAKQTYLGIRRTERTERLISSPALTVAGNGRAQDSKHRTEAPISDLGKGSRAAVGDDAGTQDGDADSAADGDSGSEGSGK